jgi:hypothetical protein
MDVEIPYTARRDDLYYPCKNAVFFSYGIPKNEAGLCAELSRLAYCRHADDFAFDRERIQGVLAEVGFSSCQFFESQGREKSEGFHAFVAVRDQAPLSVLSFRGTDKDDPTDLSENVDFIMKRLEGPRRGRVHKGFSDALDELLPGIVTAIADYKCDILFTGHSLGAAMATIMASIRAPKALYTFGSPRVGDEEFVESLKDVETYRYMDCCDVVARIPPSLLGYRHHGKRMYIDSQRSVLSDPDDEFMEKDRHLGEADYNEKYAWQKGNLGVRALADHAPFNYVMPLAVLE